MKKILLSLMLFLFLPLIANAKDLEVVTGDVSLLEDGIVFEGSGSQLPQKDEWRFPISIENDDVLIQARLFWGDLDADLGLLVRFNSGYQIEVDRANTTSEFIQFKLLDKFDSFVVISNPPEPSKLEGGYYLRCLLRTQREDPATVNEIEGVISTNFKPSENIQTFNAVRDEAGYFEVNIEKRSIFYVVLEPLENTPLSLFDLKIYEYDPDKRQRGRLRQEPLYSADQDKSGRLECIFDVETPGQYLVQVKFLRGREKARYEITLDLFAKSESDERPREFPDEPAFSGNIFQLEKSRPWAYHLIGEKRYSQSTHPLNSILLNPGKVYLDFRHHRRGKFSPQDLKDIELILESGSVDVTFDQDDMAISIDALPPEEEMLNIIFSPECKERRLINYDLFLKQVPKWKCDEEEEIRKIKPLFNQDWLSFFKKRSKWWEYEAKQNVVRSVVINWEKSSDVDLDVEVFTGEKGKKVFYSRAESARQESENGYEKFCTFKSEKGRSYYFRVTLNTRTSDSVTYKIKLVDKPKEESEYPDIVEAGPNKRDKFRVISNKDTYLLVHAFPEKSETKYKLEVIEDEIKQDVLESVYGSFYEWAIPFTGKVPHRFTIHLRPPDDVPDIRCLVVRNREYEYPTYSEKTLAWETAQEEFISMTNDEFICAEQIKLNDNGVIIKGQLHSDELVDYWKILSNKKSVDLSKIYLLDDEWRKAGTRSYKMNEDYGFKIELYNPQGRRIKATSVENLSFFYIAIINLEDGIPKDYEVKCSINSSEPEEKFEIFIESKQLSGLIKR